MSMDNLLQIEKFEDFLFRPFVSSLFFKTK